MNRIAKDRGITGSFIRSNEFGTFVALLSLIGFTAFLNPNFMSLYNLQTLGQQWAIFGILAIGGIFVIVVGGGAIDLSLGSLSANNSLERIRDFKDALKGTQIKVLNILNDEEAAAKAFSLAQSAISTYGKKLSGFYGVYYENGPAEANAVKSAGLKPGQIKVVCFDMGPDTLKYLKEGYIQASTVQKPYFMGYFGVVSIYMMKKMGKMGPKYLKMMLNNADHIDTGIYLVTPKNLQDYMAQMKALGVPPAY